jgi:D-glycero-beta-D-manno-heptose-7-phosphate kinase
VCGNELTVFDGLESRAVAEILNAIGGVRAVLLGDLCLDAYWRADMTKSELSRETPHFPLPIVEEQYSPGAGGNAAANLAALRPMALGVIGTVGQDWRGSQLKNELTARGIGTDGVVSHRGRVTNAYIKPYRRGISTLAQEDPRLDFANYTPQPKELDEAVIAELTKAAPNIDVLCVSDQFQFGVVTDAVRQKIISLAREGLKVVVDSRYRIGLFAGCILKPNELEGSAAIGRDILRKTPDIDGFAAIARELAGQAGSAVCMTLGGLGCIVAEKDALTHIPGVRLEPPLDICGAGDTFLAAFGCSLAAGADMVQAAYIANLASSVTVKKLGQTGTASREEILSRCENK